MASLLNSGRPKEGLAALEMALRLDPQSPTRPIQLLGIAIGHYYCREYEQAAAAARRINAGYPDYPRPYYWLAASLGQLGHIEEGMAALAQVSAIAPGYFDFYVRRRPPWFRPEDHAHMLDGLRKAGMPEE